MKRGWGIIVLGVALCACREERPKSDVAASIAAAPPAPASTTKAIPSANAAAATGPDRTATATSRGVVSGRSIGNTSVVFKLTFDNGDKAVFKPRSRRGRERYKGEIAAYRLAQALSLDAVPEAKPERLPLAALETALAGHAPSLALAKSELAAEPDGFVSGATIPWLTDLEFLKLEGEPLRSRWRGWLLDTGPVPEADRVLAARIATMIVFDSLTGNWDRWSGANVGMSSKTKALLFVDNDGAFMVPTPAPFERQRELLKSLKKYPRKLVADLRALDEAGLRKAMGDETAGRALLSDAALKGLDGRRKAIVDEADARIRELGEARVLVFE